MIKSGVPCYKWKSALSARDNMRVDPEAAHLMFASGIETDTTRWQVSPRRAFIADYAVLS